jgi:hypothetical protein
MKISKTLFCIFISIIFCSFKNESNHSNPNFDNPIQFKIYFRNLSSSTTVYYCELSDTDESASRTNISAGTGFNHGFTEGPTVEIVFHITTNHPAGRLRLKDWNNNVITCIDIPANSTQIYLYNFLSPQNATSYYLDYEEISC